MIVYIVYMLTYIMSYVYVLFLYTVYIQCYIYPTYLYLIHTLHMYTALDHTRVLGNTVPEIASKKAGVFKKGRAALVGPQVPMDVMRVVCVYTYILCV